LHINVSEILPKGGIPVSFSDTVVLLLILYNTGRILVYWPILVQC